MMNNGEQFTSSAPGEPQAPVPGGYLSEKDKRTFTITAGVLGAIFLLAQFVLPFVVMLVAMPAFMVNTIGSMRNVSPAGGAFWDGRIWYSEQSVFVKDGSPFGADAPEERNSLSFVTFDTDSEPEAVLDLGGNRPWLLPSREGLWLITSGGISLYDGTTVKEFPGVSQLGDISSPFLYRDQPAVIEERPDGLRLAVFDGSDWHKELDLGPQTGQQSYRLSPAVQAQSHNGNLHFFRKQGESVFYMPGTTASDSEGEVAWEPITRAGSRWRAAMLGDRPAVFVQGNSDDPGFRIEGYRRESTGQWEKFALYETSMGMDFGVYPVNGTSRFIIMTQSFPGSFRIVEIAGMEIVREAKHSGGFPFPPGMLALIMVPQLITMGMPLVLAVIFSALMRKHRVTTYVAGDRSVRYASITRRALAQIVDAIIFGGPLILAGWWFFSAFLDFEEHVVRNPFFVFKGFGFMGGGVFWVILCLVAFSVLEGKWGWSPGKWVFGIRVLGTELEPCGVGRALIRNLLKFVDGFFNFMVGVMVVALSENWQRVGDMAARTVVIDIREPR